MRRYGCFAQLHPGTKLKIIGLNNYIMDFTNIYLWGNATDPYGRVVYFRGFVVGMAGGGIEEE